MRRKLIDLMNQRTDKVHAAEAALQAGNQEDYSAAMEQVRNMNSEIQQIQDLVAEQDRKFAQAPQDPREANDMAEERGARLMKGDAVAFSPREVLQGLRPRAIRDSVTLATGTIVEPTGAGGNIRDPLGNIASSIVDQVYVQDLTGMGSFLEPYVISEADAKGGKVSTNAGTARAASADPTFGVAKISPYELNVTNYVDRNISRLSPASYYQKIYSMAMRAMRRKLAELIVAGDGQSSPDMYGIKTAQNVAGNAIYAIAHVSAVDVNLLDTLYFAYGSDEAIGAGARLLLTKADLKALGALRGTNEKRRLLEVVPDGGNPNTGFIRDGGLVVPYTICSDLTSLSTATASDSAAIQTMLYGDPMNYELGLFGDYSIRVDESIKGVERMYTILGDAMVGGNLIVDKGFVVATVPKSGQ